MASGKAVIASNVGGNPEAIVDGSTGFLFNPQDPDQLAKKILLLLNNNTLREQMARASRKRAEEIFSIEKMMEMYDQLYEPLLSAKQITVVRATAIGAEVSNDRTRSSVSVRH
jgi:glycosyltransferase involved in cell wall biosynthesis